MSKLHAGIIIALGLLNVGTGFLIWGSTAMPQGAFQAFVLQTLGILVLSTLRPLK